MVRNIRQYLNISVMALAAATWTSCHKDLCYDHHHAGTNVRVEFDWDGDTPSDVSGMTLMLYPNTGSAPMSYNFSPQGGNIATVSGEYRAWCTNNSDQLRTQDTSEWEAASVTTTQTEALSRASFGNTRNVPRAAGTEDEPILSEPPYLWADTATTVDIRAIEETQIIRFKPLMPLGLLRIRIEDVTNVEFIQAVAGTVSGLSSGLSLSTLVASESHCTMPISLYVTDDGAIEGTLRFFGHCPLESHPHMLTVYTLMQDGTKQYSTFDITAKLHDSPDQLHPEALITGLRLPEPLVIDDYAPDLEEWQEGYIDIPM